jgi:hypothetical protein
MDPELIEAINGIASKLDGIGLILFAIMFVQCTSS